MNVLGATGLHSAATKKKQRKEEIEDLTAKVAKLEAEKNGGVKTEAKSAKKGKRVKAEVDSDEEEQKPVKKKRAGKVKKEEEDDQEEVATKPARKSRAKKTVKNEEDDEVRNPAITLISLGQSDILFKGVWKNEKVNFVIIPNNISNCPRLFHTIANIPLRWTN